MSIMFKDIRDGGNNVQNAEVPQRIERRSAANASTFEAAQTRKRECWPFKWSLGDNRWYFNKAVRRKQSLPQDPALL